MASLMHLISIMAEKWPPSYIMVENGGLHAFDFKDLCMTGRHFAIRFLNQAKGTLGSHLQLFSSQKKYECSLGMVTHLWRLEA